MSSEFYRIKVDNEYIEKWQEVYPLGATRVTYVADYTLYKTRALRIRRADLSSFLNDLEYFGYNLDLVFAEPVSYVGAAKVFSSKLFSTH